MENLSYVEILDFSGGQKPQVKQGLGDLRGTFGLKLATFNWPN